MKTFWIALLALCLLPLPGQAESSELPWAASAQAPTSFAVPAGKGITLMAQAVSLLNGWKTRDSHMWPMPIRTQTSQLIQTDDPTALGLFGVKITATPTMGVALITIETSAYEGKVFLISQQRHDAGKRAHLLAYLLAQSAGVTTSPLPPSAMLQSPMPLPARTNPTMPAFAPSLEQLQTQLDNGQYESAIATLDSIRAQIARAQAANKAKSAVP